MKLIINGEAKESNARTIQELIDELEIESKVMASAVNMNVIKKEQWKSHQLLENDKVEFLQFVGGGA
ncbi:MAG: sulfur carrier protein ThiS [Sulfurospirillum sp.]|mgnify:FL=1|uniref:sulfur carrier protein ThiS n=1 Tax=Sulfurospirillum sp. UCH001 TaxID=1581011 RepID=UPI00082FA922|nr:MULTISPECIES: sulfur carrier protein ThiS [unclassified Sulfurospirillum]WNY98588.1 sulfur carrier protein ThiS [Sulfurospirillum sp. 'SP']